MKKSLILGLLALLVGCEPQASKNQPIDPIYIPDTPAKVQPTPPRFEVTRVQKVYDSLAYDGKRGIYLIKDTETGATYFGVSGIGVTELGSHSNGKTRRTDER